VSPYCFLETFCGTKIKRIKEISDVAPAAKEDADLLELIPGTSVLRQHHICYADGDMPMSSSETLSGQMHRQELWSLNVLDFRKEVR